MTPIRINNGHHAPRAISQPSGVDLDAADFLAREGSLADLGAVRPVAYFTLESHTYIGRWRRRGGMLLRHW